MRPNRTVENNNLKVLSLNTYEITGGAARAASRLHISLRDSDIDSKLLVRKDYGKTPGVIKAENSVVGWFRGCLDNLPAHFYPSRQRHNFSAAWVPDHLLRNVDHFAPDIVHLHWLGAAFLRIENLSRISSPIIWTLHDAWAFSGGCYLPGDCRKFEKDCGNCPVLDSGSAQDLSRRVWQRKKNAFPVDRMTFVAPSHWMARRARSSSLLQNSEVVVIPNSVDVSMFSPGDRMAARERLGLPLDHRLILYGARHALSDRNKGFDLLCEALGHLSPDMCRDTTLVQIGEELEGPIPDLGVDIVSRGEIGDEETMVSYYRAADVMVVPSREENLPNMVSEAMSCGLPCVAFDIGGLSDQIIHRKNGCLAPPYQPQALAAEIVWLLDETNSYTDISRSARSHILNGFSFERVALQYAELYHRIAEKMRS